MPATSDVPPATVKPPHSLTGILILTGAIACFSCMDASAKWLNRDLDPLQISGLRYLVSLFVGGMALVAFVLGPRFLRDEVTT